MLQARWAAAAVALSALSCAPTAEPTGPHYQPVPVHRIRVRPSDTAAPGETLSDLVGGEPRDHVVTYPVDGPRTKELFVFLPGTGASSERFDWLANFAAYHGIVSVALAYENGDSVESDCREGSIPGCMDDDVDCEESVRLEALYGRSVHDSECIDVPDEEAIIHRAVRLVQWLDAKFPDDGFDVHLSPDGEDLAWDTVSFGGWSQGGGHAGLIARDHLLARAIYISKGAGAAHCYQLPPDEQEVWGCDPTLTLETATTREQLADLVVPAPWVFDERATPPTRERGAVHLLEDAELYSFETFQAYAMIDSREDVVDLDVFGFPASLDELADTRVVTTAATPTCGPGEFHRSMASDLCMAMRDDGLPVLADAYTSFFAPIDDGL